MLHLDLTYIVHIIYKYQHASYPLTLTYIQNSHLFRSTMGYFFSELILPILDTHNIFLV